MPEIFCICGKISPCQGRVVTCAIGDRGAIFCAIEMQPYGIGAIYSMLDNACTVAEYTLSYQMVTAPLRV